jgi:hypothetical protein
VKAEKNMAEEPLNIEKLCKNEKHIVLGLEQPNYNRGLP